MAEDKLPDTLPVEENKENTPPDSRGSRGPTPTRDELTSSGESLQCGVRIHIRKSLKKFFPVKILFNTRKFLGR